MNGSLLSLVPTPGQALVLKVTLLLGLAALVTALLRRRSAATRHLVWLAALAGTLALPAFAPMAPPVLVNVPRPSALALPALLGADVLPDADHADHGATRSTGIWRTSPSAVVALRAPGFRGVSLRGALAASWLAGCLAVLLWTAFGHLGLLGLHRSAIPVERGAWSRHYGTPPPTEGSAGRARLALSSVVGTPLTWGYARPIILMPSGSAAWPVERRRAALLHELAHVSRGDYLAQIVATLACAVYWFHPLVWWSAARLRSESEHACDDRVLAAGTVASDYATSLLAVAHGARDPRGSSLVAIGMARPSHLEGRLLAVLDETRARGGIGARAGAVTLAVTLLLLIPFAGLRPRPTVARAAEHVQTAEQAQTKTAARFEQRTAPRSDPPAAARSAMPSGRAPAGAEAAETTAVAAPDEGGGGADGTRVENTVAAAPGGTLVLELDTGGAVEIRGWDRSEVNVVAHLGGRDWRSTRVAIGPEGSGVAVRAYQDGRSHSYSTSHEFEIRVPARCDVKLRSAGGSVSISDVEGTFQGTTGGGEILLERTKGRASLSTGGGDIEVSDSELDGSVKTGGGAVRLSRVKGNLRGSSGSGPVIRSDPDGSSADGDVSGDLTNILLDEDHAGIHVGGKAGAKAAGFLHITKAGGNVYLDAAPQGGEIHTGGGQIRIGRGSGMVEARTGGGDIEVGPVAGSVSASTGAGDVHLVLGSTGGASQSVEVWSGTGKVILELPGDLNARFDVETAYTESFHRSTSITSDWKLERDPVSGWDDTEGTPRKRVHATGVAGRGEGRIYIKTVNGDIQLRRVGTRPETQ